MKFKINSFLLVMLGLCVNTLWFDDANAAEGCYSKGVKPGQWCHSYTMCPAGCFCTGNTNSNYDKDFWEYTVGSYGHSFSDIARQFEEQCKYKFKDFEKNKISVFNETIDAVRHYLRYIKKKEYKEIDGKKPHEYLKYAEEIANSLGMFACPSEFPRSDVEINNRGAKSASECYAQTSNGTVVNKVYNKTVKCDAGKYLPSKSNSCTACKSDSRYYCPGGSFHTSMTKDSGLVSKTDVKCKAGQYLPKNTSACKSCSKLRYYICEGGTFATMKSFDQGLKKCSSGLMANSEHKKCISESGIIVVPAGNYLPANTVEHVQCPPSETKFCPGGDFTQKASVQGIKDCPFSGHSNDKKTACTITLSKEQMREGPRGDTSQCWSKSKDPEKYAKCMFGTALK